MGITKVCDGRRMVKRQLRSALRSNEIIFSDLYILRSIFLFLLFELCGASACKTPDKNRQYLPDHDG